MAEPVRKYDPEEILPEDAVLDAGTFQNIDTGRVVHKDRYGPLPPSGGSKRYIKLSDDPHYQMTDAEIAAHRRSEQRPGSSYEQPVTGAMVKTGEVVASGSFRCTNCGNEITFKHEGRVPPCSVCTHTEWQRLP